MSNSWTKRLKIQSLDFEFYRDIPIFLVTMLIFFIGASFLTYRYIDNHISKHYSSQLERAKVILNQGLLKDLLKLKAYSEVISNKLQGMHINDNAIQTVLSTYSKKIELSSLRIFKLCIVGGNFFCSTTENTLAVYEYPVNDRITLEVYLDSIELTQVIKSKIDTDIVVTLEKDEGKADEENLVVLPVSQIFSINLSIKPDILIENKKKVLLQISWIVVISYVSGMVLYLIIRYLLSRFLYKAYKSKIAKLQCTIFKNTSIVSSLNTELDNTSRQIEALQYEKKMFGILFNNAAIIEHFSNILLKDEANLNEKIKKRCLQEIINSSTRLRQRIIRDDESEASIQHLVKIAIGILSSEIQRKDLKVTNTCEAEAASLGIGQYALLQIILNVLYYQTFSLPNGKEIKIHSSITRKNELMLNFKDNGFGFTFNEFKSHLSPNIKNNSLILDWEVFEKVLQESRATINYSKQNVGSKIVITILSKEQAIESEVQEILYKPNNENKNNNVYFLDDYKKI